MTLTRRGRIVRDAFLVLMFVVIIVGLALAWEGGQDRQCRWYKQHAPSQAKFYCDGHP